MANDRNDEQFGAPDQDRPADVNDTNDERLRSGVGDDVRGVADDGDEEFEDDDLDEEDEDNDGSI